MKKNEVNQNRREGKIEMKTELRKKKKYVNKVGDRSAEKWSELKSKGGKDTNEDRAKK